MSCTGPFTGGLLVLPDLEVKVQFEPGDIIFFRACLLEHYLEDFEGNRSCLVFFTHCGSTAVPRPWEVWDWPAHLHDSLRSVSRCTRSWLMLIDC